VGDLSFEVGVERGFDRKERTRANAAAAYSLKVAFWRHGEHASHRVRQSLPVGCVFLKLLTAAAVME